MRWFFCKPGTARGLRGDVYLCLRRAVAQPIAVNALHRALPDCDADQISKWIDTGQGAPIARASSVLQAVLEDRPREHAAALLLADAALSQALWWSHVLPLLALRTKAI